MGDSEWSAMLSGYGTEDGAAEFDRLLSADESAEVFFLIILKTV
jgi:hypothetical protein